MLGSPRSFSKPAIGLAGEFLTHDDPASDIPVELGADVCPRGDRHRRGNLIRQAQLAPQRCGFDRPFLLAGGSSPRFVGWKASSTIRHIRQLALDEEEAMPPVIPHVTLDDLADLLEQLTTQAIPDDEEQA